jgi:hypothetical protein
MTYTPPAVYPDGGQYVEGELRVLGYSVVFRVIASRLTREERIEDRVLRLYEATFEADLQHNGQPVAMIRMSEGDDSPTLRWPSKRLHARFEKSANDWVEAFEWRGRLWNNGTLPSDLDPRLSGQQAFVSVPPEWLLDAEGNEDGLFLSADREARFLDFLVAKALERSVRSAISDYTLDRRVNEYGDEADA